MRASPSRAGIVAERGSLERAAEDVSVAFDAVPRRRPLCAVTKELEGVFRMKTSLFRKAGLLAAAGGLAVGLGGGTLAQIGPLPCYKLVMTPV
jgi:hypothetical protein